MVDTRVKNYDPAKITLVAAGTPIEGFADGTFVLAARNNQTFTSFTGADGEGARSKSNDKSGTVTFTLAQTSASNDVLAAIHNTDEGTGLGVFPVQIRDLNGTTLVSAVTAWVQKPADVEFGREIATREWVLETTSLDIFPGGAISISG